MLYVIWEMQIKEQWDTTTNVFRMKALITLNAGDDEEQQELSFIVGKGQNSTVTLENHFTVSYKTKNTLII